MSDQSLLRGKTEVRKLLDSFAMHVNADLQRYRYMPHSGSIEDSCNACRSLITRIEKAIDDGLRVNGETTIDSEGNGKIWVEKNGKLVGREYYFEHGNVTNTGHGFKSDAQQQRVIIALEGEKVLETIHGTIIVDVMMLP